MRGIVNDDLVDLGQETVANLEAVAATPAAALGSTRDKPDLKYCQEIFKVLKAHAIDTFFYIGGNDSSDTVRIVAEEAKKAGHALRAIHIPKTIDNDLVGFDHVPGYPSAARFVAQAFAGANLDNIALNGVYCAVVMGRHAGFLTAASALARKYPDDGPHLIYLPERTFVIDKFLTDVKETFERHGRCIIAVSEGIHDEKGEAIITKLIGKTEKDAHGNVQLSGTGALADLLCEEVKSKLGIKRVRGDTFGYLQRSFVGCVSKVDQREAREVGEKAVQYAVGGHGDGSVSIRRVADYAVDYPLIPLEDRRRQDAGDGGSFHQRGRQRRDRRPSTTICARCSARTCRKSRGCAAAKVEKANVLIGRRDLSACSALRRAALQPSATARRRRFPRSGYRLRRRTSPSHCSASGAVSPWTMTEKATTAKATMRMSSRRGRSAGSDSASASASAPRRPPHHRRCCSFSGIAQREREKARQTG